MMRFGNPKFICKADFSNQYSFNYVLCVLSGLVAVGIQAHQSHHRHENGMASDSGFCRRADRDHFGSKRNSIRLCSCNAGQTAVIVNKKML